MAHVFKPSKLIGLLALLAGLMAFSVTAAQAESGAYWEVGGVQIKDKTLLPQINAKKDTKHIVFLTKIGLSNAEILCTEIKFVNGLLHELGRFTGKIHLEGCVTLLNGVLGAQCAPHSPGAPAGLIETQPLEGLLKLHNFGAEDVFELLPVNAEMRFVTLQFGSGTCALPENLNITGTIFLKDCEKKLLINQLEHLFEAHSLTKLFLGVSAVTIDGSFWTFLEGAHKGQLWSGHPA